MNIETLFEPTNLEVKSLLCVEPLAPLSLVTSMPGAYYRSERVPSKFMIYGMLENLLGWHLVKKERGQIIKKVKAYHKKHYKTTDLPFEKNLTGYIPLLQHHLTINQNNNTTMIPAYKGSFEDYWTLHLKGADERHAKGTRNYDVSLNAAIDEIYTRPKNEQDKAWQTLLEENSGAFPMYYQSPTKREYIVMKGKYGFEINTTKGLFEQLNEALNQLEVPLYLGTNEGWVELTIESL